MDQRREGTHQTGKQTHKPVELRYCLLLKLSAEIAGQSLDAAVNQPCRSKDQTENEYNHDKPAKGTVADLSGGDEQVWADPGQRDQQSTPACAWSESSLSRRCSHLAALPNRPSPCFVG